MLNIPPATLRVLTSYNILSNPTWEASSAHLTDGDIRVPGSQRLTWATQPASMDRMETDPHVPSMV